MNNKKLGYFRDNKFNLGPEPTNEVAKNNVEEVEKVEEIEKTEEPKNKKTSTKKTSTKSSTKSRKTKAKMKIEDMENIGIKEDEAKIKERSKGE